MVSLNTIKCSFLSRKLPVFQDRSLMPPDGHYQKGWVLIGFHVLVWLFSLPWEALETVETGKQNPHKGPGEGLTNTVVHKELSHGNLGSSLNPYISKQASSCLKTKCLDLFLQPPDKIQISSDFWIYQEYLHNCLTGSSKRNKISNSLQGLPMITHCAG